MDIAIRLKIQTKSSHKIHRSELLRLDFVNLNSWIAIVSKRLRLQAFFDCFSLTKARKYAIIIR